MLDAFGFKLATPLSNSYRMVLKRRIDKTKMDRKVSGETFFINFSSRKTSQEKSGNTRFSLFIFGII
jgi:hypothetical protein